MKKILSLFCLIAIAWLCNVAYAGAYKTLTFPDDNQGKNKVTTYTSTWTATIGSDSWEIAKFNNNSWNSNWTYIKCGREKAVSTASIATKFAVDKVITNVVVTIDAISNSDKINSIKMIVASDEAFANIDETVDATVPTTAGDLTFNVSNPLAGRYYKIVFDMQKTGKNGNVQISKVVYNAVDDNLTAPIISGVENGGLYINSVDVIIDKPTLATSMSYNIKKDGVTIRQSDNSNRFAEEMAEPGEYTVSASATDGTNTLKADDVTFTIKSNKVASIAEFLALAPRFTDTEFEFDCNLIVTYADKDSKNLYVRDETGAPLLIYMDNKASTQFEYVPENGDFFDRGVKGKYKLYNTIQELVNPTFPLCNAHQAAAEPKEITIGAAADNMSQYVKIKNVKFNSTTVISCGEETIEVSGTLPADVTAQYNVVGLISQSKSSGEWLPNLLIVSYEEVQVLGTPGIEVTGETNATGSYLDKATLKFVYPANATSMDYVVKKGEKVLEHAEGLTEDATCDIKTCGDISIVVTAYKDGEDPKTADKPIKIIPSAPTVSLAAGTYHEAQTLTITAPEGATLDGLLGDTDIKNVSEYTTTLTAVNEETTTYELLVCSTKDGASSDAVSATFVIDPNVIDATVTGVIDMADIDDSNFIKNGANMVSGQEYSINDSYGTKFSFSAVKGGGSNMPFRTASTTAKQCLRLYWANNSGNVLTIGSEVAISKIAITTGSALKIDGEEIAVKNSVVEKEYAEGCKSFTIEPTKNKQDIYSIAITYSGKVHFDKVKDGAALIGMKKGKLYKVNVALQGIEANGGVLYARTTEPSAAPSEPGKDYFDKGYEDYDLTKFDQRDWVAIKGLSKSDYAGKEIGTGFIADYDGEKLTPMASSTPAPGSKVDIELNTFGVANVFYGNYKNTENVMGGYKPFFVKAKVNEVANYVGEVKEVTGGLELWGSGVCGKLNNKGLKIDANGIEITASAEYQQIEGVLVADAEANGGVKIVALSAPTIPTGVAALKADGKATVYGTEGAVVVNGADGKVMIFDAMGRMVKSVNAEGAATVAMPAGYYIVRTAGTAAKVMVK